VEEILSFCRNCHLRCRRFPPFILEVQAKTTCHHWSLSNPDPNDGPTNRQFFGHLEHHISISGYCYYYNVSLNYCSTQHYYVSLRSEDKFCDFKFRYGSFENQIEFSSKSIGDPIDFLRNANFAEYNIGGANWINLSIANANSKTPHSFQLVYSQNNICAARNNSVTPLQQPRRFQ